MFAKKVPLYMAVLGTIATSALLTTGIHYIQKSSRPVFENEAPVNEASACDYKISRLSGYKFTRPLMYAEPGSPAAEFSSLRNEVNSKIQAFKVNGTIKRASVYIREFSNGKWTSINDSEKFSPGSLLKIPELIAFFKMNEKQPGLLNKKLSVKQYFAYAKKTHFPTQSIELNKEYSIRELLYYMIRYSDNNATMLLNQYLDEAVFKKVFTDLGMAEPNMRSSDFKLTAKEFSVFMKVLYNASYLNIQDSETCLEMMSEGDFKNGLLAPIPSQLPVAHKFGEGGADSSPNFSETAIVISGSRAFLVTIMTEGNDLLKLPEVTKSISQTVFDQMTKS